jgi:phosphatidylserine/phosphatidylglycerophosphate/cardiolipin synthase-like enzyme
MVAGDQFFLPEADAGDETKFRAPQRPGVSVTPLIDGIATFKAMELAIASAKNSVHIAVWTMLGNLPLQSPGPVTAALKASGMTGVKVTQWDELFAAVAGLGVETRIIISDFDGILQSKLHRAAWEAYRDLRAAGKKVKDADLEVICSLHNAHLAPPTLKLEFGIMPWLLGRLIAQLNKLDKADGVSRINTMPRLWPFVNYDKTSRTFSRSSANLLVWPASHHQKIFIVDGATAFCGGLDPQPGRLDTPNHGGQGWHDTHVQVDGALAADLERNFVARWNAEGTIFNTFIAGAATAGKTLNADPVTTITATASQAHGAAGAATGQLLRTVASTTVSMAIPINLRQDVKEAVIQAIAQAKSFIYIENQYVRDAQLLTWLSATPATVAIILVLPIAPEEMAAVVDPHDPFSGPDPITMKGVFIEDQLITNLRAALPGRFGAYSMVQKKQANDRTHKTNSAGSFEIYVHSKTMIVDDQFATIGSANLNPRSHLVDTEANIGWYDPAGVKKLRLALWREMLGNPPDIETWTAANYVAKWDKVATDNAGTTKELQRKGFIVPHDVTTFPGADDPDIPVEYVELTDQDPLGAVLA